MYGVCPEARFSNDFQLYLPNINLANVCALNLRSILINIIHQQVKLCCKLISVSYKTFTIFYHTELSYMRTGQVNLEYLWSQSIKLATFHNTLIVKSVSTEKSRHLVVSAGSAIFVRKIPAKPPYFGQKCLYQSYL